MESGKRNKENEFFPLFTYSVFLDPFSINQNNYDTQLL